MTPFSSVAMLEKLVLFRIALCNAPALSTASLLRASVMTFTVPAGKRLGSLRDGGGVFISLLGGSVARENIQPWRDGHSLFERSARAPGKCISNRKMTSKFSSPF